MIHPPLRQTCEIFVPHFGLLTQRQVSAATPLHDWLWSPLQVPPQPSDAPQEALQSGVQEGVQPEPC